MHQTFRTAMAIACAATCSRLAPTNDPRKGCSLLKCSINPLNTELIVEKGKGHALMMIRLAWSVKLCQRQRFRERREVG
uniref:Putative secreted protein n=1 Tax=Anopheles darlingi TaxID=43151 RepID=A0A2M4DBG0_ANODA